MQLITASEHPLTSCDQLSEFRPTTTLEAVTTANIRAHDTAGRNASNMSDMQYDEADLPLPPTQSAIVQGARGKLRIVEDAALPSYGKHDLLVQVMAVALNPCDWKMPSQFPSEGATSGCDFAGIVVRVGAANSSFEIGHRVFGAVRGASCDDHTEGSFAEFLRVEAAFTLHVPDRMSWTAAASLGGVVPATLGLALFDRDDCAGTVLDPAKGNVPVLIWAGSSAIGTMAIQLCKLCVTPAANFFQTSSD